jgi:hypothetical protein
MGSDVPSPNAFERSLVVALAGAMTLAIAPLARADDKQACSTAYADLQTLRRDGKLQAARQQAAVCTRDVCTAFIRDDCTKWLGEIEATLPSVVIDVRDAQGQETAAVRVLLDGQPWLDALDGKAKPIDPGQHTLRFEMEGTPPIEETVQIREGEKNRKLSASFQKGGASSSSRSIAPWIVGGAGVAVLVVGAITGGLVLREKSITDEHCSDATRTCDAEGRAAASRGRTLGPISTVSLVVGGLGVGVSTVWLLTRGRGAPAPVQTGFVVTGDGGAFRIQTSW